MLKARQETILKFIVDDYIRTAAPIASETIARKNDLGVSPATIRKELAELEEVGYISRPHTSAGSVPRDKAYRLFVESLVTIDSSYIPSRVRCSIRRRLNEVQRDMDEWVSVAATVLARLVGNMAVATFPKARESRPIHLELVPLQEFFAMLVVVMEHARLRRQLIRLSKPVEPMELEATTNAVKSQVMGRTLREIETQSVALTPLEEQVLSSTMLILRKEDQALHRDRYVDGLRNLLVQPEFSENEKVRALVEGVEDGSLIKAILEEAPQGNVVRVIIGQENRGPRLSPLSVVICQYGIPGETAGALGAVGPTRMEYSKTIAGVKFMSSVMSDVVESMSSR